MRNWKRWCVIVFMPFMITKCVNPYHERVFSPSYFGGEGIGVSLNVQESVTLVDRYLFDPVVIGQKFSMAIQMLDDGEGRNALGLIQVRFLDRAGGLISEHSWEESDDQEETVRQTVDYPRERVIFDYFELPASPEQIELKMWFCSDESDCDPIVHDFDAVVKEREFLGSFILRRMISL